MAIAESVACPPPIPGIEWELTTRCNYDCSYCLQRKSARLQGRDSCNETIDTVLSLLREKKDSWLVKLSGGEPFLHPRFLEITRAVTQLSHRVASTTNFSASRQTLEQFLEASGERLAYLTASLHLEQVRDVPAFVEKARWFQSAKPGAAKFIVTTVGIETELPRLQALADGLADAGISFEVAPRKDSSGFVACTDPAFLAFMDRHSLAHVEAIRSMWMLGTMCHAGSLFARITIDGDGLRCYDIQPRFALGNVVRGDFKWLDGSKPCLARHCTCTVPANRNMIEYGNRVGPLRMAHDLFRALFANGPALVRLGRTCRARLSAVSSNGSKR